MGVEELGGKRSGGTGARKGWRLLEDRRGGTGERGEGDAPRHSPAPERRQLTPTRADGP